MHKKEENVMVVLDLNKPKESLLKTVKFASDFAFRANKDLVIWYNEKNSGRWRDLIEIKFSICNEYPIDVRISREKHNFLKNTYQNIIEKENVKFVIVSKDYYISGRKKIIPINVKTFTDNIISLISSVSVPVIIAPENENIAIKKIITPVDRTGKVQKYSFVIMLLGLYEGAKLRLFVQNSKNEFDKDKIATYLRHANKYLTESLVEYDLIYAKNKSEFSHHLLRFAFKKSDMIVLETNSATSSKLKKIIGEVGINDDCVIVFVPTKMMGNISWK
ncbi:MAG: hypothetical protein WC872_01385 [Candidatus Absconditabacterales bacterium]|jgi:hypothetical protein